MYHHSQNRKHGKSKYTRFCFIFYVLLDIFSYTFTRLQNTTDRLQVTKFKYQTFRCGYMYFEIKSRRSNFEIGGGGGGVSESILRGGHKASFPTNSS